MGSIPMTNPITTSQFLLDLFSHDRRDLGNDLVDVLRQYNENMLQYSATVNTLVAAISTQTRYAQTNSLAELLRPNTHHDTETFEYHASENGEVGVCPITHESFQEGDSLMRIRRCGHTFKRAALMEWFSRRRSCPVCRGTMG
jgi:hypothetical protein